jgi:hypothetical protein
LQCPKCVRFTLSTLGCQQLFGYRPPLPILIYFLCDRARLAR